MKGRVLPCGRKLPGVDQQPDKRVEGGAARCLQRSKLVRIASRNFVTSLFIACLVLFLKTHSS